MRSGLCDFRLGAGETLGLGLCELGGGRGGQRRFTDGRALFT